MGGKEGTGGSNIISANLMIGTLRFETTRSGQEKKHWRQSGATKEGEIGHQKNTAKHKEEPQTCRIKRAQYAPWGNVGGKSMEKTSSGLKESRSLFKK